LTHVDALYVLLDKYKCCLSMWKKRDTAQSISSQSHIYTLNSIKLQPDSTLEMSNSPEYWVKIERELRQIAG